MTENRTPFNGESELRKKAEELLQAGRTEGVRDKWLALAEEAAQEGDFLLSEYAYQKALGLRVLW